MARCSAPGGHETERCCRRREWNRQPTRKRRIAHAVTAELRFSPAGFEGGRSDDPSGRSARILSAQLFDIAATNPYVLAAAAVGMLLVGSLSAWLPARRAARIDPVVALRTE